MNLNPEETHELKKLLTFSVSEGYNTNEETIKLARKLIEPDVLIELELHNTGNSLLPN